MKTRIKRALRNTLYRMGYTIMANSHQPYRPDTMEAAVERIHAHGINPAAIIDVGAAEGSWSESVMHLWPEATYHLVEPLQEQEVKLKLLREKYHNVAFHIAVAGEEEGEVFINVSDDLHGSGVYGEGNNKRNVPVVTIDKITGGVNGPFIIKLDTHGYEIPILRGAKEALKHTEALIIEVYGFHLSPTCALFHDLSTYLDESGFRMADIVEVVRRPSDNMFWQADVVYYRKDNKFFNNNDYAKPASGL